VNWAPIGAFRITDRITSSAYRCQQYTETKFLKFLGGGTIAKELMYISKCHCLILVSIFSRAENFLPIRLNYERIRWLGDTSSQERLDVCEDSV